MYYDEDYEQQLLSQLKEFPKEPLMLPEHCYDKNGNVQITVDYLKKTLLRHLWELVRGPLDSRTYLHRVYGPKGNLNPWHYTESRIADPKLRNQCRNGHPKIKEGACQICYQGRLARKRKGGLDGGQKNALKTFCPQGHPYDTANTRIIMNKKTGKSRRQCRACEREYAKRKKENTL